MSRINTNVTSLISSRILSNNQNTLNTSLERLSTGLRINQGKDDPAGLIASETLRSELAATSAAIDNANRADKMISVAEGALQEVSSLLIELESLVDSTANTAALSDEEVAANQLQIDSILDTINRISSSTEFQGKKLLNGTFDYTTSGVNSTNVTNVQINSARLPNSGYRSVAIDVTASAQTGHIGYNGTTTSAGVTTTLEISGQYGTEQLSFASSTAVADMVTAINQSTAMTGVSASLSGTALRFDSTDYGSDAFVSVDVLSSEFGSKLNKTEDYGQDVGVTINGTKAITNGLEASIRTSSLSMDITLDADYAKDPSAAQETFEITAGGANFSIAPRLGLTAMASLGIQSVSTGNLGTSGIGFLSSLGSGQTNQLTSENFEDAQQIIREANKQVSGLRGRLGAFQKNTLSSAINAMQVAYENTTAAESAIRDADFAAETSQLTRSQILVQSATTVLQMASSSPQNVLTLLQ